MEHYEIVIGGQIDSRWSLWFEGMSLEPLPGGRTLIRGPIKDQSALHAMLSRIRDLGIPLLLVRQSRDGLVADGGNKEEKEKTRPA